MDCKAGPEMVRETRGRQEGDKRETRERGDRGPVMLTCPTLAVSLSLISASLPAFVTKYLDKTYHKMSSRQILVIVLGLTRSYEIWF